MSEDKIIFVYNADSSLFAQATDFVHKIVSPRTYECNLCLLTYGHVAMKREWQRFLAGLEQPLEFLHRDEFIKRYPDLRQTALPAIFLSQDGAVREIISAPEIDKQKDLPSLKSLVRSHLG